MLLFEPATDTNAKMQRGNICGQQLRLVVSSACTWSSEDGAMRDSSHLQVGCAGSQSTC
jgi:hypothetical protein